MNKEDKTVERMDKMIEQVSLITNAAEELIRIVSECPTCKGRYNEWLRQAQGGFENKTEKGKIK